MCYKNNINVFNLKTYPFLVFLNKLNLNVISVTFLNNYYIKSSSNSIDNFFMDKQLGSVSLKTGSSFGNFRKLGNNYLNSIPKSARIFFYKRVSYSGKGYRLYIKSKSKIYFQLGYSHKYYLFSYGVTIKPILKSKLLLLSSSLRELSVFSKMVYKLRPLNIFTLKGIRFTRQLVYKKVGKVSSYR